MKLSEIRGERALDVFADLLEPASEIFADNEVAAALRSGKTLDGVRTAIKGHKKAVIAVLAVLDGEPVEMYAEKINVLTIPAKLLELLNEPELLSLFSSPSQNERPSGDTSESTTADKE